MPIIVKRKYDDACPERKCSTDLFGKLFFEKQFPRVDVVCFHQVDLSIDKDGVWLALQLRCKGFGDTFFNDLCPSTVNCHFAVGWHAKQAACAIFFTAVFITINVAITADSSISDAITADCISTRVRLRVECSAPHEFAGHWACAEAQDSACKTQYPHPTGSL